MELFELVEMIKQKKIAGIRYEKEGHHKFRDCVTICQNKIILFERYCYGEAAGKVCTLWAKDIDAEQNILWDYNSCNYTDKTQAPVKLTGTTDKGLLFDGASATWLPVAELKTCPEAGLGRLKMLFR